VEIVTEHRQRDEVSVAVFFTSGMSMGIVARRMASVRASETKAMTAEERGLPMASTARAANVSHALVSIFLFR